jgi:hypothetical protein
MPIERKDYNFDQYMREVARSKRYPTDAFQHASFLLDTDRGEDSYSSLVNKEIQLAHIGNDQMLNFNQIEALLLTHLCDMARRDPELRMVYEVLYGAWANELKLTKTKGGAENKMQHAVGSNFTPREAMPGYGSDYGMPEDEEKQNIIAQILGRKDKNKREG